MELPKRCCLIFSVFLFLLGVDLLVSFQSFADTSTTKELFDPDLEITERRTELYTRYELVGILCDDCK